MTELEKQIEQGFNSIQESINKLAGYDIPDKVHQDFETRLAEMRERYEATVDENNDDTDEQKQAALEQLQDDVNSNQASMTQQMSGSGEVTPRTSMK